MQSIVRAIHYNPALLWGVDPATPVLFTWDGSAWAMDGIALVSHDIASATLTIAFSHLSDFALFGAAAPTELDPEPESGALPQRLFLPAVMSQPSGVTLDE